MTIWVYGNRALLASFLGAPQSPRQHPFFERDRPLMHVLPAKSVSHPVHPALCNLPIRAFADSRYSHPHPGPKGPQLGVLAARWMAAGNKNCLTSGIVL